jgi:hypothetical protein
MVGAFLGHVLPANAQETLQPASSQPVKEPAEPAPFGEASLQDTPFARAFSRMFDRLETGPLGRHLEAHPDDTTLVFRAMKRIGAGDFSETDDATVGALVSLYRLTLPKAPESACARIVGPEAEEAFLEVIAAVDSTGAEAWAAFFERIFVSSVSPGRRSPPASPEEVREALAAVVIGMGSTERALWGRFAQAPESLSQGERCQMARLVFATIDDIPGIQRAGVIRALLLSRESS